MGRGFLARAGGAQLAALLVVLAALAVAVACTVQAQSGAPTVTSVEVTSNAGADDTYGLNDVIRVTLTFNQAVTVTGTPQLQIDMDPADWGTKDVPYVSGSGTTGLVFAYTVVSPNISRQGIAVVANSLTLNGGTIQAGGVNASLAHSGLPHNASHKVDHTTVSTAPASCSVTLSGVRDDATSEAHITWTVSDEWCDRGGHFVDIKQGTEWTPVARSSHLSNHEYRHGNLQAATAYEFRVRTIDARGVDQQTVQDAWITTSNPVTVGLVGARLAYFQLDGPGEIIVYWDTVPAFAQTVTTVHGYRTRYREEGTQTWTTLALHEAAHECLGDISTTTGLTDDECHVLLGLKAKTTYEVQIGTEFTKGGVREVAYGPTHRVTNAGDPMVAWWVAGTPTHNREIARVFMHVQANYSNVSAVCTINGGPINCPPGTLVSLDTVANGVYTVRATAGSRTFQTTGPAYVFTVDTNAGGAINTAGASGGDGKLFISWESVYDLQTGMQYFKCTDGSSVGSSSCSGDVKKAYKVKGFDTFLVQYRRHDTTWQPWRTIPREESAREHEVDGLSAGTYQMRVVPCVSSVEITGYGTTSGPASEARPTGGTETGDLQRCWQPNWADDSLTYKDDFGVNRGMASPTFTVVVASDTSVPSAPREPNAWATSPGEIYGRFHPSASDGGSTITDYELRYRKKGTTAWSYRITSWLHPDVTCLWTTGFACNKAGQLWVGGLESGATYELGIRARNANGGSPWAIIPDVRVS